MSRPLTVYFLCETFSGYRNYFMQTASAPQGLPPLYNTWNGYAERGHNVHIFTQDYMYDGYSQWTDGDKRLHNIPLPFRYLRKHRFTFPGRVLARVARLVGLRRLRRYALRVGAENPPDIIYSCSPWCSLVAQRLAEHFNAVHVVRRFGTVLCEVITGKKRKGLNESVWIEAMFYSKPFDLLVMGNDGTIGDRVALHYGCPKDKLRFWTNGVNKELADPDFDRAAFRRKLGYPEDTPLLLTLSRLSNWKRIDRALDIMTRVRTKCPEARLLVVGEGEAEDQFKETARRLGVDDVTNFVGPVQHREVGDYFNGCDVYIQMFDLTNRCNPLYEAMVCKMAVLTLTDPSIDDIVEHEKTALRVDKSEMDRAAQYAVDLIRDEQLRHRLGAAARTHILDNFQTWPERIEMEVNEVVALANHKKATKA